MSTIVPIFQHPALWRGNAPASVTAPSVPSGIAALDALLPGGGWPRGALTEIACNQGGIGELSMFLPALARLSLLDDRWIVLITPPHVPYAPALASAGVDLAKVVLIRSGNTTDIQWATEQTLRSDVASAVLSWPDAPSERMARRLQLASEAGGALAVSFVTPAFLQRPSAAPLRGLVHSDSGPVVLQIIKRRSGGWAPPVRLDGHVAKPVPSHGTQTPPMKLALTL